MHTLTPSPVPAGGPGVLEIAIDELGDLTVVGLHGPLDIYTATVFRERVEGLAAPGARLVVDLTGVTILDSSGLGALLRLRNRVEEDPSSRLGLVCPRRRMRRIFDITGLRPAFVMERDVAGVLRAWSAGALG